MRETQENKFLDIKILNYWFLLENSGYRLDTNFWVPMIPISILARIDHLPNFGRKGVHGLNSNIRFLD